MPEALHIFYPLSLKYSFIFWQNKQLSYSVRPTAGLLVFVVVVKRILNTVILNDPRIAGVLGESFTWCPFLQGQMILAEVSGEQLTPLRPP